MPSDQRTALSRPLIRWRPNLWPWRDQPPASAVQDLRATDHYKFRLRNRRGIEVLVRLAREKEALRWVTQGGYEISVSGFHYGPIVVHEDVRMTRASESATEGVPGPCRRLGRSRPVTGRAVACCGAQHKCRKSAFARLRLFSLK